MAARSSGGGSRGGGRGGRGGGAGSRGGSRGRGFAANTAAPRGTYAVPPNSPVGGQGVAKYPIDTQARARNALARVQQNGTAQEKQMVFNAVKRKYPALARRSSVVPTPGNTPGPTPRGGGRGGGRTRRGQAK